MKNFTVIENSENEVMMIPTDSIENVVYLNTGYDHSYILDADGELASVEGYYSEDYFTGSDERLVVKADDIKDDKELMRSFADAERFSVRLGWDDEDTELIDATGYMSYVSAKRAIVEHGINHDEIIFDADDDDYGWKSVDEVTAEHEHEYDQDYPRQEATCIWTLSNGKKIRETFPFFSDDHRNVFEYIDNND